MSVDPRESPGAPILCDAHVHVHDCYRPAEFFDRAYQNLEAVARRLRAPRFEGVLWMSECAGDDWFGRFAALARAPQGTPAARPLELGGWAFQPGGEEGALLARVAGGARRLLLVAGRQVACAEGLEVLALGTLARFEDGLPIRETLARVRDAGALAVIPWGAGKWLGQRAELLSSLLRDARPGGLFLGDESARPIFWPTPRHLREAAALGIRNLPGSDPLPFPRENGRAGSYGFWLHGALDAQRPVSSLKALLRDAATQLHPFGRREWPLAFLRNQIAMQLRKRRAAPALRATA